MTAKIFVIVETVEVAGGHGEGGWPHLAMTDNQVYFTDRPEAEKELREMGTRYSIITLSPHSTR